MDGDSYESQTTCHCYAFSVFKRWFFGRVGSSRQSQSRACRQNAKVCKRLAVQAVTLKSEFANLNAIGTNYSKISKTVSRDEF